MNTKNFDNAIEAIGQGIYELGMKEDELKEINTVLDLTREAYVLVQWPESQELMEEEWFEDEAILDVDSDTGSAYFIPLKYLI